MLTNSPKGLLVGIKMAKCSEIHNYVKNKLIIMINTKAKILLQIKENLIVITVKSTHFQLPYISRNYSNHGHHDHCH